MLNTELYHAAEMFVAAVQQSDAHDAFMKARTEYQNDPELRETRKRFNDRSTELHAEQSTGTLTQDEINELRALQSSLNTHAVTVRFVHTRQEMVATLQECNRALSRELGFDFASAAAPPSCCG